MGRDAIRRSRWHQANGHRLKIYKRRQLLKGFGLSLEDYDALLTQQAGGCKLCGRRPHTKSLNVDHDHQTGKVRGLLCPICNSRLGWLETNRERLEEYLK